MSDGVPDLNSGAIQALRERPRRWLVTGAAGFIGSNLAEALLGLGQRVVGVDNFSTGHRRNLDELLQAVAPEAHAGWRFIEGDIRDLDTCREACAGVEVVLHQAALGSVPRSIADPIATNASNVDGFLNLLVAARDAQVSRFVYAASSSTYGDHPGLPKVEDQIGRPLSPYAVSKLVNELYASVFCRTYGMDAVGLRYFNVFGRRQDPNGAYAAVIPRWAANLLEGRACIVNGDGHTSRDFCYIDNVVQANLLAASAPAEAVRDQVFNVACGTSTSLNELYSLLCAAIARALPETQFAPLQHAASRPGDVRHSLADISKIVKTLGYRPRFQLREGLEQALAWYLAQSENAAACSV